LKWRSSRQSTRPGDRRHQLGQARRDRPDGIRLIHRRQSGPGGRDYDLGYLFSSFPQQTKAFDAGAAAPIEQALLKGANIRIIAWAYNFGARSVLARKAVNTPEISPG